MVDVHKRSHRQYPHDMALAAVWEQGYLTALADLQIKANKIDKTYGPLGSQPDLLLWRVKILALFEGE